MDIKNYDPVKEGRYGDWTTVSELETYSIVRHPPNSLLGRGKADVGFYYKKLTKQKDEDQKRRVVYGPEEAVFHRCMEIINLKKNPSAIIKMKEAFAASWKLSVYSPQQYEILKKNPGRNLINKFIADKYFNPFDVSKPPRLLEEEINKRGLNVKQFSENIEKNKSSVYHHTSGKRDVSREVAIEYSKKLKCDPVDLMFNKLSIPVWGKVNLLKAVELEQPYDAGRIFTYYTNDKDMERVVVPRDLYQEDIKAIKISALGSMYDNQVAFYYRATQRDEGCLNKLCIVGIKGDPDNPFDNDDKWFFGLYENVRGKANLINPDPFISNMENKYILQDCRPDIMAPVVAVINPEAIVDKTKMKNAIPPEALIREEERLLAEKATIKLAQEVGKHQRKVTEQVNELNQQIANIQEKLKEQVSDRPDAMNWLHQEKQTMQRFRDKITNFKVIK